MSFTEIDQLLYEFETPLYRYAASGGGRNPSESPEWVAERKTLLALWYVTCPFKRDRLHVPSRARDDTILFNVSLCVALIVAVTSTVYGRFNSSVTAGVCGLVIFLLMMIWIVSREKHLSALRSQALYFPVLDGETGVGVFARRTVADGTFEYQRVELFRDDTFKSVGDWFKVSSTTIPNLATRWIFQGLR